MKNFSLYVLLAVCLFGCGYPGKGLNSLEKQSDIAWIYGVFERNYAPADWKQKNGGQSLEQAKAECQAQAEGITDGGEFIAHINRCVNRFHDAHTHIISGGNILPEFAKVAYLGFKTETVRTDIANPKKEEKKDDKKDDKKKDDDKPTNPPQVATVLKVKEYLPTTNSDDFPVKVGDFILEADGKAIEEYLTQELVPYNNLGNANSSVAEAGGIFALRSSHQNHLPAGEQITLKLLRGENFFTVTLPWTFKDLLTFNNEQAQAKKLKDEKDGKDKEKEKEKEKMSFGIRWEGDELIASFYGMFEQFRTTPGQRVDILLRNSFRYFTYNPMMSFLQNLSAEEKKPEKMPVELAISAPSLKVDNESFPARVFLLEDGTRIGYVRVESFSLGDKDVKNFAALHEAFTKMKVKGVIYDMLNNGGGSLVHGLRMANLLTEKELQYPSMQLALNDNWLNSFKADSIYTAGDSGSDARRTKAEKVYKLLKEDVAAGLRISRPISTTELDPFVLNDSKAECAKSGKCLSEKVKRVLLVNEMCASMCDIFASAFRDNKLGTIVGSQTMGAGGNVVMHGNSPISNIILRQTESLILDVNGEYLENQGVKPDEAIDTLADASSKYSLTYKKALDLLK